MDPYRARPATLDDVEALVHHRVGMFTDMGIAADFDQMADAFRAWLAETMPTGVYRAWVVEADREVVAGGGISILPWPPGPRSLSGRVAFVYNVYTDPAHRNRGVGRLVMEAIHAWCREHGIDSVKLNASQFGQALYASMGYHPTISPMMHIDLDP